MLKNYIEGLFFLRIVFSPLFLGIIIGFFAYKILEESSTGLFLFGLFSLLGLFGGIFWAIKVIRKEKPSDFISRSNASSDIDDVFNKNKF